MKIIHLIIPIAICLVVSCSPSPEPVDTPTATSLPPTVESQTVNSVIPTPTATIAVSNSPLVTPTPIGDATPSMENESNIDLAWPEDETTRIMSARFCCGFAPLVLVMNYIVEASVWGDGRIIWVEEGDNGSRQIFEGRLTPDQIQGFLERAAAAGFFTWEDRYADPLIADAPEQCLMIQLADQTKEVCEELTGAPPAFHDLYAEMTNFDLGASEMVYIPEQGYLTATELTLPDDFTPPIDAEWPADTLSFSLDQAVEGVWVEGDILETAWDIVNNKWQGMILLEGDRYYEISVQLPELSLLPPPPQNTN
ncbi:MAG: hypothetical protein AAF485_31335 [Chloroflexota bacterium]